MLRAVQPLGDYPKVLTDRLAHWSSHAPERTLLAWNRVPGTHADNTDSAGHGQHESQPGGRFSRLTYGEALVKVRCLGQALLDRHLTADRPLAILSGNSVEHLLLALAAQHVGVPHAPISPAYSLVSSDFSALEHVLGLLSPGLVFVSDRAQFAPGNRRDARARCRSGAADRPAAAYRFIAPRRSRSRRCSRRSRPAPSSVARADRARRCRQDPVHVRLDRDAEGRDQYAPHALQQPADDPADAALPR